MITDSLCAIRCGCGHEADYMEFVTTPLGLELPPGHYQCRACRRAWHIVKKPIIITRWGTVISEPNEIVFGGQTIL